MKTKEITVYLSDSDMRDMNNGKSFVLNTARCTHHTIMATLIIPEKKITISESELWEAVTSSGYAGSATYVDPQKLYLKLFSKADV